MKRCIPVVLALLFFSEVGLAQDFVWRTRAGDQPAYARPDFDDSTWESGPGPKFDGLSAFEPGVRWYRTTIPAPQPAPAGDLAIGIGPLNDAYQVFVEGVQIGHFGSWEPKPDIPFYQHRSFRIPAALLPPGKEFHVAIRRWRWPASLNNVRSLLAYSSETPARRHPPAIAPAAAVEPAESLHAWTGLARNAPQLLSLAIILLCGLISLALFSQSAGSREYLWLGLYLVLNSLPSMLSVPAGMSGSVSIFSALAIGIRYSVPLSIAARFLFLAEVATPLRRILCGVYIPILLYRMVRTTFVVTGVLWDDGNLLGVEGALEASVSLAVIWFCLRKRSPDYTALALGLLVPVCASLARSLGGAQWSRTEAGGLFIDFRDVAALLFALIMLAVVWWRYVSDRRRQVDIEAQLASAQEVQALLVGVAAVETPGFDVETVYRPSQEVGGDFFQLVPHDEDGSLLVVVGDVSGKGLRAAMVVSLVVGSLRYETSRRPGEVLSRLNAALTRGGTGGFVTCCCARFDPDGSVTLANAGHLAPYVDGREAEVESGLPLGIAPDVSYPETTTSGSRFTFISDGVLEAANPKGELFGFERSREISGKAAAEIAAGAQAWGQNDDITVVTVRRKTT